MIKNIRSAAARRDFFFALLLSLLTQAAGLLFFLPQPCAANDFRTAPEQAFDALIKKWETSSAEIELKFKNLTEADLAAAENQIYYLFITGRQLGFLTRLLLKSGNEKAAGIAGLVLSDVRFGYTDKTTVLSEFSKYISGADGPGAARAVKIVENFVGSPLCGSSKRLFIEGLKAMCAGNDEYAVNSFMRFFEAENNAAVKSRLLGKISDFSGGLDILKNEYEKAAAANNMTYGMEVINALAGVKDDKAFFYLTELMNKLEAGARTGPLYNHVRDLAAGRADERFMPVIEKMIASENTAEITKGFEYLRRYSKNGVTAALAVYGKISGAARKIFFLRNLVALARSKSLEYMSVPDDELKSIYSILKDALNSGEPALVKESFGIICRNLNYKSFKKIADADIGECKFLMPLAFYINGERSHFINQIKAGIPLEAAFTYANISGAWYNNFAFDPADFKTDTELNAFFRFVKLQHKNFQYDIIAQIVKTGGAAAVKKLAEFSRECSFDFIDTLKSLIIANIARPEISADEFLVEFSGYKTSRKYLSALEHKKRKDAAGGDLKKYLLAIRNAGSDEFDFSDAAICEMLKTAPGLLAETLNDRYYPLDEKLRLMRAVSEKAAELKDVIDKACLKNIIVSADSGAKLSSAAGALLARFDESAALDALKTALSDPAAGKLHRELLLQACGEIKTPECAQFLADAFIAPALDSIAAEKQAGEGADGSSAEFTGGGTHFKTAALLLNQMGAQSKNAVSGLLKQKPKDARVIMEFLGGCAEDEAVKYYLDNFDAKTMTAQCLFFLRRIFKEDDISLLKEFYSKKSSDKYARIFAAALFYKNNIAGPAAAEIEKGDGLDAAVAAKLFDAACDYDFITDFYGADEKYINKISRQAGKYDYKISNAENEYKSRFADPFGGKIPLQAAIFFSGGRSLDEKERLALMADKTTRGKYLKYLSADGGALYDFEESLLIETLAGTEPDAAELRELAKICLKENFIKLRAAVKIRLKELFQKASQAGASKKPGASVPDDILDALIDCSDINDFEECAALAKQAVKNKAISPAVYASAVWRLCAPFDAEAAGWQALTLTEKSELVSQMLSHGYFDPVKLFGANAYLYTLDFNLLSESEAAEVKFLDELIAVKRKEGFDYKYEIYALRLLKTKNDQDKLKFIIDSIGGAGENDKYNVLGAFNNYFSFYAGEELKKSFAAHYSGKLSEIKNNDGLIKMTVERLNGETLRGVINACETSKESAYDLPQCVFDAYAAGDDPEKDKYLAAFCRSENYAIRNNSLRSLRGSGDKGFAILKALFESAAAGDSDKKYQAGEFIGAMAETGSGAARGYLCSVALDEKLGEYRDRAVGELGEIKTVESLDWLVSRLFAEKLGRRAFDTLLSMCREMTLEFLEAEKKASGKTRAAIASILFQNSIQQPFMELMANGPGVVEEIGPEFRPQSSWLDKNSRDGALPRSLLKKAVAAVSEELKKAATAGQGINKDKMEFYSYLCRYLSYSENPQDISLMIKLLGDANYADSAARALTASAQDASGDLMKAARADGSPAELQKRLIRILTVKNVSGAKDIFLKALASDDRDLVSAALEAVSKFKIKEAVPVMVRALASAEGEQYYLAGSLAGFGSESFDPLIEAMAAGGNTMGLYSALNRIVGGAARGPEAENSKKIKAGLLEKHARYSKENSKAALLTAFLLADLDGGAALKESMAADAGILTLAGEDLFNYFGRDKFIKLGAEATAPLMSLFAKSSESRNGRLRYDILDIIEKTGDATAAPALAAFLKTPGDERIKRRALEVLSKISKDSVAAYLSILSGEKDYQLKLGAAKCLAEMTETDEFCRAEILKLLHGGLEDEIKALLIKALAKAKYAAASAALLEALKNSQSRPLLDAASDALYGLDILDSIRANLKNILKESPKEINQAYAARVLGYYGDSGSVEAVSSALEKALEKASEFKKIELIKAAAAINSDKFIGTLSRATADASESVRQSAALALKITAGDIFMRYCAPGPPASLKASPLDGAVELNWEAPPDKAVKYYEIYRDGKPMDAKPSGCAYTDKGLKNGKNYSYHIKAVDADSNAGAPCAPASAVPSAPPGPVSGLKLKSGLSYITLEWKYQAPDDNAVEVDHFVVERGSRPIAKLPPGSPGYTDYGLSAGKIYAYKVYAVNRMGGAGEKAGGSAAPHFNMKGGE